MTTITALHPHDDLSLEAAFNHPVLSRYGSDIAPVQESEFKGLVLDILTQTKCVDSALSDLHQLVECIAADRAANNDD